MTEEADHLRIEVAELRDGLERAAADAARLTRERDEARATIRAQREALLAARSVMWMAREYAEAGGASGPEMRDFSDVEAEIADAIASSGGEEKP